MTFATRFAPSPTGPLHLGHAFSAMTAFRAAQAADGRFHLRLDDLDHSRVRSHWAEQIEEDLAWLGIAWHGPIWRQSERLSRYQDALATLWSLGLIYPCTCTRSDIKAAAHAPQEGAPLIGPDGVIYPGTCRTDPCGTMPMNSALRLNMKNALQYTDIKHIEFIEVDGSTCRKTARQMVTEIGDVVLARRDMGAAYHLAIVLDDADQAITDVIRGEDLREATFIHVLLQRLLCLPTPRYAHHRLIRDDAGKRLAKRDDARAISKFREDGATPQHVLAMIGL